MLSVFDIFSIGIGPSSSHTVGPMRAAKAFSQQLIEQNCFYQTTHISTELFGSLGQTGKGHGSGKAVILGLLGYEPETIDSNLIEQVLSNIEQTESLSLLGKMDIRFPNKDAIIFHRRKSLPQHSNAMTLNAWHHEQLLCSQSYFSIGGGFIIKEQDFNQHQQSVKKHGLQNIPFHFSTAEQLLTLCKNHNFSISDLMLENELAHRSKHEVTQQLWDLWLVMSKCIKTGIKTEGILPGGLKVIRRAPTLFKQLQTEKAYDPMQAMDWVNLFALAVNEENAAGGRVVTAPTNGAAGIIPAVLSYFNKFISPVDQSIVSRYLLTAAAIGILYKTNASISGAEVGCQGEVGVACSMAAGALTEIMGGTVNEVENAAEIGMEHNLGLTCDPVGGLVQVPCIERNAMGAIKAINASRLALRGTGQHKVSLDKVIRTMWQTGNDMKSKYKETARGGLAVNIIEC
ncbi:L-serine ammonia-lyase [Paraglaciecola aquimarina]|uniref:L-serine dehydratase n=1 Tax=Paraglaciecola algarum TaxID=3050085 RepID=A0ABS9D0Y9_9ALTE|nr:L-serine ammonia-lyase [Paraglaciecola sp. G1-23]MCF2946595.1 L-serine ammonia-lyase [Paraglaciecola sp. G1-23]